MSARHRGNSSCLVLAVLALAVVLGGALGTGLWRRAHRPTQVPHNTLVWLRAQPEDRLFYPGSVVLKQYGTDGYRSVNSGTDATSGTYLGVDASSKQVVAFYAAQLPALGWVIGQYRGNLSTEKAVAYWQRDDLTLKIGVLYNDQPDGRLPTGATGYTTAYTLELLYTGLPRPSSLP